MSRAKPRRGRSSEKYAPPAPSGFHPYRLPPPVAPPIARQLPASHELPFCPHSKHVIPCGIKLLWDRRFRLSRPNPKPFATALPA